MPPGECTSTRDRPAGGDTGRLFLTFGGPVCADRISYCPLDRVLTYKNLICLLNLQICYFFISLFAKCLPFNFKNIFCYVSIFHTKTYSYNGMSNAKSKAVFGKF